jgi:uncharacterized protein (TIGR02594 family)
MCLPALLARGKTFVIPAADPPKPAPVIPPKASVPSVAQFAKPGELPHIDLAKTYIGTAEIKGRKHNPKILELRSLARTGLDNDEDPWCSDFVCGCIEKAGMVSARTAGARKNLQWGQKLDGPCVGAVVIFWRGSRSGWSGHVGFVVGRDKYGNLMVLGGNQSDAVNVKPFSTTRVLGYRFPNELLLPKAVGMATLPVLRSDGRLSTNEA